MPEQRKALEALKRKYYRFDRESLRVELMPLVAEMYEVPIIQVQDGYKLLNNFSLNKTFIFSVFLIAISNTRT